MNATSKTPVTICLKNYKTPAYLVDQVELNFNLLDSATRVFSTLQMFLNPDREGVLEPLILDGEQLNLLEVKLDGTTILGPVEVNSVGDYNQFHILSNSFSSHGAGNFELQIPLLY